MVKPLRINFELDRADNPVLYDDLARFCKGTKRVGRLRMLAHTGLLLEGHRTTAPVQSAAAGAHTDSGTLAAASIELFGAAEK